MALVPRTLRSAISAFTRVFDALWIAAWCAADPGPIWCGGSVGPGSAEQREVRCTASGTRDYVSRKRPEAMRGSCATGQL